MDRGTLNEIMDAQMYQDMKLEHDLKEAKDYNIETAIALEAHRQSIFVEEAK